MNARRLVATLLEADDMLPPDDLGVDPKEFIANVNDSPMPIQGVTVRGYYADLERKFMGARVKRDGPERFFKIENNTWLVHDTVMNTISVRLHQTDIITVTPEDTITVDNGGWQTVTTQARLNDYLPGGWKVYTQKGDWYWHNWREEDTPSQPGFKKLQPYSNGD